MRIHPRPGPKFLLHILPIGIAFTIVWGTAWALTIINDSPITKTLDEDDGIAIFEINSLIVNTSTVTTRGVSADGLRIDGENSRVENREAGVVITEGDHFAVGIRMGRGQATVHNAGSITTSGSNGDGIVIFGDDNNVSNTGSILVQGVGADGFVVEGDSTHFDNYGVLSSTGGVRLEDPSGNPIFDNATGAFLYGSGVLGSE